MSALAFKLNIFNQTARAGGFSFIGVIMIIFALAVFTTTLYVAIPPSETTRAVQLTQDRAKLLQAALKTFKHQHAGAAPASLMDLVTTTGAACSIDANPASATYKELKGWCGPYLDQPIGSSPNSFATDGWGVNFAYDGINLKSCGPDRTCGNSDDVIFHDF